MPTRDQLAAIMPHSTRVDDFIDELNRAMDVFDISTPARQAAFLAQVAHESGELRYTAEIASGAAYEGRADLGNTDPGDGTKYRGRGLIQLTGKKNYSLFSLVADHDFVESPADLELPGWASVSAAWYWANNGLNALADMDDFEMITRRINGGLNGYAQRCAYWDAAKRVLGA